VKPRRPCKPPAYHLKKHKEKEKREEEELRLTVERSERELMYHCLYKMGEMNEWCNEVGVDTAYRAFKTDSGELVCHIYTNGTFQKEISRDAFLKRYKALQSRVSQVRAMEGVGAGKDASTPVRGTGAKQNGGPNPTARQRQSLSEEEQASRKAEIRNALLQTMQLTNKLKEQLAVLDKKAAAMTPFVLE